ncbi:hypothetical protein ABW21_db0208049 [Orbilia brochopaga]|nr:hypothetical protein ABW21_db0208049 [Drechslerella brochopaga]
MAATTILSLADEILLQIAGWIQVVNHDMSGNARSKLIEHEFWDHTIHPSAVHALTRTCRRFRQIAYPIYYEKLQVGLGKDKMPVSSVIEFVRLVDRYPERGAAVKELHLGPWLPKNFWIGQAPAKGKDGEWDSKADVLQELSRISIDLGLDDPKFLQAIKDGKPDMLLALLLYSLPELDDLNFAVMSFSKPPYKVSSRWLAEAFVYKSPRCAETLDSLSYRVTGACPDPWSSTMSELMKFPKLKSFGGEPLGRNMKPYREDSTDYGEFSSGDSDEWESVRTGSDDEDEDEWQASDEEEEVMTSPWEDPLGRRSVTTIIGGAHGAEGYWSGNQDEGDTDAVSSTLDPGTCNLDQISLWSWESNGIPLEDILAAPKALTKLYLMWGTVHAPDDDKITRGILSQAASLTLLETDFHKLKDPGLLLQLNRLTRLQIDVDLFILDENPESPTSPNSWLPKSIERLELCELNPEASPRRIVLLASRMLRTINREALPKFQYSFLTVSSAMVREPHLQETKRILKGEGIDFRYAQMHSLAKDEDLGLALKWADAEDEMGDHPNSRRRGIAQE